MTTTEVPSTQQDQVNDLMRRMRDLQRENDILRAASHFFKRELDPRPAR